MLRFYDTARASVTELVPRDPGAIGMYVCGPTVYDAPHIGHGRSTLVYDVLRRYLTWRGLTVRHVSNVTDIDDKIIDRAAREGRAWQAVAEEWEAVWWDQMGRLGVERPDAVPHATDYIPQMIELISELVERDAAYLTSDGAYLASESVEGYGLLAQQPLASLRAGARVDVVEDKRSPFDFALWKLAKPGEPSWPSPFGVGRPGWHTECVAMSLELLGDGFDIHGGGLDLRFPHHENERAQAAALGRRFAGHWIHHGLVTVGGEKMSKSLGNFETLAELLDEVDPRAYRLLVLQSRYRSPLEVTAETLGDAEGAISRIDALARRIADAPGGEGGEAAVLRTSFQAAMDDDLDTPSAISALFEALRRANALLDEGDAGGAPLGRSVVELLGALGLAPAGEDGPDAPTAAVVSEMDAARAARDFAKADALRARLEADGWQVENTPSGSRVRR